MSPTDATMKGLFISELLAARDVEIVATPALTPALSPRRGRILRRVLSNRAATVIRKFSLANHQPTATDHPTPESSERVRLLFPLPGGEGQGEGERYTNFVSTNHRAGDLVRGMIVSGIKPGPKTFCSPIPLTIIPLTQTLFAFLPLR